MPITEFLTMPCTLRLRSESTTEDGYGNRVMTTASVDTVCSLQQAQTSEPAKEGEMSSSDWELFLPAGTTLNTGDAATVDGETFEVIGEPWHVPDPFAAVEHHVEVRVRRTAAAGDTA